MSSMHSIDIEFVPRQKVYFCQDDGTPAKGTVESVTASINHYGMETVTCIIIEEETKEKIERRQNQVCGSGDELVKYFASLVEWLDSRSK